MGNSGRFGKYGESKRLERLRKQKGGPAVSGGPHAPLPRGKSRLRQGTMKGDRIAVRPAKAGDAPFIRRLSRRAFQVYGPYGDTVVRWFASGMTATLIAFNGDIPAGFAIIGPSSEEDRVPHAAELLALAVEPGQRRKGIGKALMGAIETIALQSGVQRILLHTSTDNVLARRLFEGQGYEVEGLKANFYPRGQDALLMCREPGSL